MNCLHCDADNLQDFPVCTQCETICHFSNRRDCRCLACADERQLATLPAVLQERLRGSVLIATSDDPPSVVRFPFTLEAIKPEYQAEIAQGLAEMFKSLAKAA